MFSQSAGTSVLVCLAASLVVPSLVAAEQCNIKFHSGAKCAGTAIASCIPDDTASGRCIWNTYVGSAYWTCGDILSLAFWSCSGSPATTCPDVKSISVGDGSSGCVEIGTKYGYAIDYENWSPGVGNI
ncbi:hypothetical protein N7513_008632 [Penicillium frequentans]|nr:hypothetical protein N7513_008632 [Penicillium glabrum]